MLLMVSIRMGDPLGNRVQMAFPTPLRLAEVNVRLAGSLSPNILLEGKTPITKDLSSQPS
jgi:hypothetical protein